MNKLRVCPDIRDFQGLASGQLPAEMKESLLLHLEGCDSCVLKIQALPADDTLVGWIQQVKTLPGGPRDMQLAPLIQRLIQLRKTGATPPKPATPARTFAFSCPGCGKSLRVKEEAAGKKVKCPQCGQVAQTPAAERPEGAAETPPAAQETGVFTPADAGASAPITKVGMASAADLNRSSEETQFHASSKDQKLCSFLAPSQAPDELGRLGPYRVLKVLGAGGMGVVFRAEDPQLQRLVALKAMLPDLAANESARQRFLREARAAAKLKHDHIVTIFQVGEDRGAPFLAMEFLEGEALEDRIKRAAPGEETSHLSLAEIIRIGREIAEGLEAAHEHGLIHRDIKPGNVWLEGKRGRVKILDFGLARSANEDVHLTQSGAIVGTPAYMPPEQARGEAVDGRCDLYSLGCVLYRMCTGQLPFKGDNTMSLLLALATEQPKSVRELNAEVPPALADLIMRLLEKDPAQRPATARAVADALSAIDTGEPIVVKVARAPVPPRRRRRLAVAVAGGALVLAALLTVIVIRLGKPEEGTVTIETVDPDVELIFTSGGKDFKVHDKKTGKEIKLPLGTYQVKLKDDKEGLKLNTNQFTLMTGGDRALVKVTWKAGDQPKPARADIPAPIQVAEPPPLAEWLKGRTILTVSQDGKSQFKTIQAALNALKPGQVVKVLDRGPYRERLSLNSVPEDTGLVSEQQTVLELSEWLGIDKETPYGHYFAFTEGFRVHGFALIFPTNPKVGFCFAVADPNGFVLENCLVQISEKGALLTAVLLSWWSEAATKPVWVRDCMFRSKLLISTKKGNAVVVAERNYLDGPGDQALQINGDFAKVVIRHNVLGARVTNSTIAIGEMKEVDSLEVRNNTTTSIHPFTFAYSAPRKNVTILNNLRSQPGFLVLREGIEKELPAIVENWLVGYNAYPRQFRQGEFDYLRKQNIVPQASTDVLGEPKFLSLDPAHPDYLRLAADSLQAKGGAGGAWPSYIGALPPGPAPKDGDWFTRLRRRWGDLAHTVKPPSAPVQVPEPPPLAASPLDALDPAQIPAAERFAWQPKELVAVIGEHRQRHWSYALDLALSPDGATAATADVNGYIRFWDTTTLEPRGVSEQFHLPGVPAWAAVINALAYVPAGKRKGLVWWGGFGQFGLLDPKTGSFGPLGPDWTLPVNVGQRRVKSMAVSPDGNHLALSGQFAAVLLWDVSGEKPRQLAELKAPWNENLPNRLSFSPDSGVLAYQTADKEVRLIDVTRPDLPEVARLAHEQGVCSIQFAPDGKRLAVGDQKGMVTLWDLTDKGWIKRTTVKLPTPGEVSHLAFSRSGKQLAMSGGWSFTTEVWEMNRDEPRFRLRLGEYGDRCSTFTADERCLITIRDGGMVRRWELGNKGAMERPKNSLERSLEPQGLYGEDKMLLSADGRRLAARMLDGKLRLWDLNCPQPRECRPAQGSPIQGLGTAFSPDGTLFATYYGESPFTRLWDVAGLEPRLSERYKGTVNQVVTAFSQDGKHVYAFQMGEPAAQLVVLDGSDPVLRRAAAVDTSVDTRFGGPMRIRFSAGTLGFKLRGERGGIEVWDVKGAQPQRRALLHKGDFVRDLALSPDGTRVACAFMALGAARGLWIWDVTSAKPRMLDKLDAPDPTAVCFTPDGQRLVWGEHNGRLVLWDFAVQGPVREWKLPGRITQVAIPRDGRHIFTYNGNGTIYVLRLARR